MTRAAHAAHAAVAAIYLPPNGVEVHYVQTANMRRVLAELARHKLELTHPRAYLTYDAYEIAMRSLVFCEWTDTETSPATTKYFGFVADDAASVFGPKSTAPETDREFLVARGFRRFRETLAASINRQKTAIVAIDGAARRGTSEHAFLAFLASVALHDDPVADATLTPLECIARVALVSSHTENEKQRAMAALKKRTNASYTKDLYSFLATQLCDLVLFLVVYGVTAVNFTSTAAFFAARFAGSAVGSAIGPLLIRGDGKGAACWFLCLMDIALSLVAVLVPFGTIVGTMALIAGSSVVSEARSGCDSVVARFLSAIGSQFVRVVSGLIVSASYKEDVASLVHATTRFLDTQNLLNLGTSLAVGVLFETLDGYMIHEIKQRGVNPFFVCFMRLACHMTVSGIVGGFNEGLGAAYRQLLVPRWINISRLYTPDTTNPTPKQPTKMTDDEIKKQKQLWKKGDLYKKKDNRGTLSSVPVDFTLIDKPIIGPVYRDSINGPRRVESHFLPLDIAALSPRPEIVPGNNKRESVIPTNPTPVPNPTTVTDINRPTSVRTLKSELRPNKIKIVSVPRHADPNVAWLATQLANWRGYFRANANASATAFGARNFI
jgi:hypothetical protein